jgi:probable phosphoglycerate mutase
VGTIHLIRHGDTEASGEGVFCGDLDPPLAPSGLAQAAALVAKVKELAPKALYVSPKLRARLRAEASARALDMELRVVEGLREISYGTWDGRKEVEIRASEPAAYAAWTSDPALTSPPGGESAYAIATRAMPVIAKIRATHPSEDVAVFSHKATIRIITCVLLGVPLSLFRERVACPTASITSFAFVAHGPQLVRLGETA